MKNRNVRLVRERLSIFTGVVTALTALLKLIKVILDMASNYIFHEASLVNAV